MARMVAERHDVVPVLGEIFRRYGFEGASIARISEHTKLGKGSLYHFFPGGKDEMANAVLSDIDGWFETHVFSALAGHPPVDAIDAMFLAVEDYFQGGRRICLVGVFALDDTRNRFAVAVNAYFSRWLMMLAGALRHVGFGDTEAEHQAAHVVAGIQGAIVLARALDDERKFAEVIESLRRSCRTAEIGVA